jgi:hypothetical protein
MPLSRRALAFFLLAALVALAEGARAQGLEGTMRVLPCRPTISCSADLVPPGALEIELGYAARRVSLGGFVHMQPVLIKLTVLDWLQLQVGSNGYVFTSGPVVRRLQYIDDISVGLKTHFLDQTDVAPSIAASWSLNVPSPYRNELFPYAYDASFWAYASKDLGPLHLDANGGLNVWQFDLPDRSFQPFVSVAATLTMPLGLGAMAEGYWFDDGGLIAPPDAGILLAGSWAPNPRVMFDVGTDASLVPSTRTYTLFAGVTFIPGVLWEPP